MISKKIHYCWFGENKKSKSILRMIETWKKKLPDYEIIEWNEKNFDIENSNDFVKMAYANKKWAFVSDYVRLYALKKEGGIYLDTDVEVIKSFDDFLKYDFFISQEADTSFCTAVIGAKSDNEIITNFLKTYDNKKFSLNGPDKIQPNSIEIKNFFEKFTGLNASFNNEIHYKNNIVLPRTYFCAKDIHNYKLDVTKVTISIHHLDASWYSPWHKFLHNCKKILFSLLKR
ncbi:MAG: glycosyl transferase [Acholeplasmatales bacterium]|nr:glycosyl transferase [Acholeplasmatales bacterium]